MELNYLKYFYTVAKEGSFTKASKILRIQQPTISKMVKSLEDQLGLSLMERHKKGIRLTKAGGEIYRLCDGIFDKIEEIESFSDHEKSECSGSMAFGVTDSVSSYLIPEILGDFVRQYPKVRPSIFSGTSNLICNEILDGKVEFGIFFTVPDDEGFQITELVHVPFQLVIAQEVYHKKEIRNSFIISRDIDYPKSRPFPVLEMLRKNQVGGETFISSNNLDSQKELVKQGLGISLLPRFMVKSSLEKGTLVALHPKRDFSYALRLVTRKGKVLSTNAATFLDVFQEKVKALI